jgi:hypothetical protein
MQDNLARHQACRDSQAYRLAHVPALIGKFAGGRECACETHAGNDANANARITLEPYAQSTMPAKQ